jgi:fatty-acid peroxygenase
VTVDLSWALWRAGYRALPEERSAHAGARAYPSRLVGRRAIVVRGREGTRLFYDPAVIQRTGAVPPPLAALLFGRGAVHGLDGEAHAERKAMFLEALTLERVEPLAAAIGTDLHRRASSWRGRDVQLYSELVEVYGAAVLAWAGIECTSAQARRTSHRLAAIVDGFGGAGAAYPRGWAARIRADRWARHLVECARRGDLAPTPGSALDLIANGPGRDLDARTAGVELLNILRPTVAVAWPATFAALALARHEQWRALLRGNDAADRRRAFGHEVRRTCPFVPALAGRAHAAADIDGERVEPGDMVVLDVPGTNHDPEAWDEPEDFLPERFADVAPDPYEFVPQGGGDPHTGHRCPGEPLTVRMIDETLRVLAEVDYSVVSAPSYDATRIPTLPARGLVVRVPA